MIPEFLCRASVRTEARPFLGLIEGRAAVASSGGGAGPRRFAAPGGRGVLLQ